MNDNKVNRAIENPVTVSNNTNHNNRANLNSILLYALSLTVAMGFNDLILTIFDSFPHDKHIISKTTYVVIMIGITLWVSTM